MTLIASAAKQATHGAAFLSIPTLLAALPGPDHAWLAVGTAQARRFLCGRQLAASLVPAVWHLAVGEHGSVEALKQQHGRRTVSLSSEAALLPCGGGMFETRWLLVVDIAVAVTVMLLLPA